MVAQRSLKLLAGGQAIDAATARPGGRFLPAGGKCGAMDLSPSGSGGRRRQCDYQAMLALASIRACRTGYKTWDQRLDRAISQLVIAGVRSRSWHQFEVCGRAFWDNLATNRVNLHHNQEDHRNRSPDCGCRRGSPMDALEHRDPQIETGPTERSSTSSAKGGRRGCEPQLTIETGFMALDGSSKCSVVSGLRKRGRACV